MESDKRTSILRIIAAIGIAGVYALLCYALVDWARPDTGFVSISFALIQPAAISAFVCYVADPLAGRRRRFYLLVPLWLFIGMIVIAAFLLQEGAVCIAMLAPVWLISGLLGAHLAFRLRKRDQVDEAAVFLSPAILALPLVLMPIEAALPVPEATYSVRREIIIDASADLVWPLMEGIPDVHEDEGRWNVTQDLLGVPRPLSARLSGKGPGSIRFASWEHDVAFREIVTQWLPGRKIHWRFDFDGSEGWEFTDRHLRPDSTYLQVLDGGYTLSPLPNGKHLLTLETRYIARTPFNSYASLWGELFLGDLEMNLLEMIRARAERAAARES
ncbi:MAG: SRPBCC family protein [Porphyrobacter sp.]|nr:SRPBCC family protein [Porphyrobacter sp.]